MFDLLMINDTHIKSGIELIAYTILKTQGDILMELGRFNRAIKAYKTLKDFLHDWGQPFQYLKMKTFEQIAVAYRTVNMNLAAVMYYKKALMIAWVLKDNVHELSYYERLSMVYMNLGDTKRMADYHTRATH